jgi:hypothetical protein
MGDKMRLDAVLLVIIICVVIFGGALVILNVTSGWESEDRKCKSPYLKVGDRCCIDSDFNNVCDAFEETQKEFDVVDTQEYQQQIDQMKNIIENLKDDIGTYKDRESEDYYRKKYYDLTVTVKDDDTDDRIEDAYVRIRNGESESDKTNDKGRSYFYDLKEGCYDIKVSHSDYETEYEEICIHQDRRITIYLEPED